jgi:adenylylsulfate kinase
MGLPGAGKTTLARALARRLSNTHTVEWLNADVVRGQSEDWDFSHDGRLRQSSRMAELADRSTAEFVVADFVAPLPEMRNIFRADVVVWVDTIQESRFPETDQVFLPPENPDFRLGERDAETWAARTRKVLFISSGARKK